MVFSCGIEWSVGKFPLKDFFWGGEGDGGSCHPTSGFFYTVSINGPSLQCPLAAYRCLDHGRYFSLLQIALTPTIPLTTSGVDFWLKSDHVDWFAWIKKTLMMTGRWQVKQPRGEMPSVKKLCSLARIPYHFTSPGSLTTYQTRRVHVHVANRDRKVRIIISYLPLGQFNSYLWQHKCHWNICVSSFSATRIQRQRSLHDVPLIRDLIRGDTL